MATLFVVATPIGNLADLSSRAIETLRACPVIVAEDTRHSGKLLRSIGVEARLISFNEHNVSIRIDQVLAELADHDVALVTDAGTPAISDPGYQLVAAALNENHQVRAIAGPSAVVAALSVSGLPATPFTFHGYAPRGAGELREWIERWTSRPETSVFFESPNRIARCMTVLATVAPDCAVTIAREMTKIHEQIVTGSAFGILEQISSGAIRAQGEFVVVALPVARVPYVEPLALLDELFEDGATPNQAAKAAANLTGLPKSELYKIAVERYRFIRSGTPTSGDA